MLWYRLCEFLWVLFLSVGPNGCLSVGVCVSLCSRSAYEAQHVLVESLLTFGHGASRIDDETDYLFIYY